MRDPQNLRALSSMWLGLLFGPATIGFALGLNRWNGYQPELPALALQWLVILGVALGTISLVLLRRFRALEAGSDENAIRLALPAGAGAADLPMICGIVYLVLGGEREVFWAMCGASTIFIALFRPRR